MNHTTCPSCNAKLSVSLQVEQSGPAPSSSAPPVLRSSPALHAVPEDRETPVEKEQARRDVEKRYRDWLAAAPDAVRGKFKELVGFKLGDWRRKRRAEGKRDPEDYEVLARTKAVEFEALGQLVDEGFLRAPRPRPNTTYEVLPRGDRDEDPSEEE